MFKIQSDIDTTMEIKKSRFLTYLHRCTTEADAKAYIVAIKKQHPHANHYCYAFVLGEQNEIQRSNDDGEPAGSAGLPMLECLMQRQMQDLLAVTVRYFGGIKLGVGGLYRAYFGSVAHALDHAVITKEQCLQQFSCTFSYDLIGKMDQFLRSEAITLLKQDYEEQVTYTLQAETVPAAALASLSAGTIKPQIIGEVYVDMPVEKTKSE